MTEHDPHQLRQRLESGAIAHQRSDGTWIVACVPRLPAIRPGSVRADRGPAIDLADDPRPANYRNVPPFGGGF